MVAIIDMHLFTKNQANHDVYGSHPTALPVSSGSSGHQGKCMVWKGPRPDAKNTQEPASASVDGLMIMVGSFDMCAGLQMHEHC